MISVNYATVQVQGSKIGIMAELATLVNSLYTKDILTKEDIEYCVKIALLSEDELKEETEAMDKKAKETVKKKLDEDDFDDEDDSSKEEVVDAALEALKALFFS